MIIENNIIPFKGFKAINLFGIIFKRKDAGDLNERDFNHEAIHTAQMKELLYIPFYIIYFIEWFINCIKYMDYFMAYRDISFEREAYKNQGNLGYLKDRKHYSQWR